MKFFAITICFCFLGSFAVAQSDVSKQEAVRVWDLAIAAKGGREALTKIHSVHFTTDGRLVEDAVLTFPFKLWEWEDYGPGVFGRFMTMYDSSTGKSYSAQNGVRYAVLRDYADQPSPKTMQANLSWMLMDTDGISPEPQRVIYERKTTFVSTTVNGIRVDYGVDPKSYLLKEMRVYYKSASGDYQLGHTTKFADWTRVQGIMVPLKVDEAKCTYEFNVPYNPDIFNRVPRADEFRKDWWQK